MPNADRDFVIRGRRTPIRERSREPLSNSLRTSTSENLSHTRLTTSGNTNRSSPPPPVSGEQAHQGTPRGENGVAPPDVHSWDMTPEKSELSLDLGSLNSSLNKSYNEIVGPTGKHRASVFLGDDEEERILQEQVEEALQKLVDQELGETQADIGGTTLGMDLAGKALSPNDSAWFTEPPHLIKSKEYPIFDSLGVTENAVSSVKRPTGVTGTGLAQRTVATDCSLSEEARKHFPVTLGEVPNVMRTITPPFPPASPPGAEKFSPKRAERRDQGAILRKSMTHTNHSVDSSRRANNTSSRRNSMPSRRSTQRSLACNFGGVERTNTSLSMARHSIAGGRGSRQRDSLGSVYVSPRLQAAVDYNYLKASQPYLEGTAVATPYQYELARLKMERLRIEEQRLLAIKREEELERIRGPEPKWYELKSSKFTYEHSKNNKLIRSRNDWQDLLDYRSKLLSSSRTFGNATL